MDNIIIYNTDDGKTNVKLYANDGTVWLPRPDIAELFQCTRANVALHIKNIYTPKNIHTRTSFLHFPCLN